MGTALHHFVRQQGRTILSMLPVLRNRLGRCLCMPDRPLCFFPCFGQTQRCASAFLENLSDTSTKQDETNQPLLAPDKETNLYGKSSAANPSESIWNNIASHLENMLSTSEYTLPFQCSGNLSCLPVLGSIQSNTHNWAAAQSSMFLLKSADIICWKKHCAHYKGWEVQWG